MGLGVSGAASLLIFHHFKMTPVFIFLPSVFFVFFFNKIYMTQKKAYKSKHPSSAWSMFEYGKKKSAMLQICL